MNRSDRCTLMSLVPLINPDTRDDLQAMHDCWPLPDSPSGWVRHTWGVAVAAPSRPGHCRSRHRAAEGWRFARRRFKRNGDRAWHVRVAQRRHRPVGGGGTLEPRRATA